ncbi:MAG: tRNA 2-thiocytidine(32) synthetase TtcA [Gammaproteobacteria bacterium]|nr:tRNA 2-thiocytidine(32) synthetase TtcA [Gammaproteobacteria bacterium]
MKDKSRIQLNKLQKRLRRQVGEAIHDYSMIENGDRVMVCVSGGKDSLVMLDILMNLQKHAPVEFELAAVNLDQKQPGFPAEVLPAHFQKIRIPYRIIEEDTYSLVTSMVEEGKTYCGWCSRFRRGILYRFARENGYNKIALGHHRDDIVETLFLNLFYGGRLKAMPPRLLSDDGENIVIRPLAYCREKDILAYSNLRQFPVIPCDLCGSQDGLQRQQIKLMLTEWERRYPGRVDSIFRSLSNVIPSHLLDTRLFNHVESQVRDVEAYVDNYGSGIIASTSAERIFENAVSETETIQVQAVNRLKS